MKKVLLIAGVAVMMVFLILYPENCLKSARVGLDLWLTIVLPSLLPFMVASFILLETGIVRLISHFFAPLTRLLFSAPGESAYVFFASAFSGYPVGAKLAGELYAKKQITEADAQAIVRFTSVTGPVFITGAVGVGMLGAPESGAYLIAAHYLSAVLVGIVFGLFGKSKNKTCVKESIKDTFNNFKKDIAMCRPLGELLSGSIEKSLLTLLKIGGFLIVFSVIMEVLTVSRALDAAAWVYSPLSRLTGLTNESTKSILIGGIEMTTGCSAASALDMDISNKLPVVSSIIAFGGFCIHMQTKSVCAASGLVPKRFMLAKSLQAVFAYALCSLSLALFPFNSETQPIPDIKTAAFFGLIFAACSLIALLVIKYIQKTRASAFPFGRKL
jgi:sporulation integral membrane protein YlbJ